METVYLYIFTLPFHLWNRNSIGQPFSLNILLEDKIRSKQNLRENAVTLLLNSFHLKGSTEFSFSCSTLCSIGQTLSYSNISAERESCGMFRHWEGSMQSFCFKCFCDEKKNYDHEYATYNWVYDANINHSNIFFGWKTQTQFCVCHCGSRRAGTHRGHVC